MSGLIDFPDTDAHSTEYGFPLDHYHPPPARVQYVISAILERSKQFNRRNY